MAIAEGINLTDSVSGKVYANDDVIYTFYDWRSNSENLIYGKVPNYAIPGDYHLGRAYVDEKGVGLITFVPTETYPFVQFRIVDNKVTEIVVYYYGL